MNPYDDAPEWRQLADTRQNARKWYPCDACPHARRRGETMIPPGQRYRKIVGLEDGKLFVFRECCGPCPHAEPCGACNATGFADAGGNDNFRDVCPTCDGTCRTLPADAPARDRAP